MDTITGGPEFEAFRAGLRGDACTPGEAGYDGARRAFNLNALQHPALVVMAESTDDVQATVRLASDRGLGVGVMATGHGVGVAADGGVLINTSRMRGVSVDPEARTARVEAGALWADVTPFERIESLRPILRFRMSLGSVSGGEVRFERANAS